MKKRFLISVAVFGGIALLGAELVREMNRTDAGNNAASVSWLPKAAHNISFFRCYWTDAYEFDIPEADFLNWAKSRDLSVVRGTGGFTILRCHFWTATKPVDALPRTRPYHEEEEDQQAKREAYDKLCVKHFVGPSYHYSTIYSNGGGVNVGYDIAAGRAYCNFNAN